MFERIRYLLLQVRNPGDPMRVNEVAAFARALRTTADRIGTVDLLTAAPTRSDFDAADVFLLGGSGHYSVACREQAAGRRQKADSLADGQSPPLIAGDGAWLERALESLREIHRLGKPTFASCWGFQAFSRALGGLVVHDLSRAEVGTHELRLTAAGQADPIFGPLGETFSGQMGHEDCVASLPAGAIRLASSALVENQAYRFEGLPIYCTQFHPELNRDDLLGRVRTYPEYIARIAGVPPEEFCETLEETPDTEALLTRFVATVFGS